jgi:alpha-L-fucosidase
MKNLVSTVIVLLCLVSCSVEPPKPFGALPSQKQIDWQKLEYYMFIHFGPNTFTNVEWGDGKEDPSVFNPSALDCRQWAATAKAAGMKGIILTVKHHDGFCLWPSEYSTHTVRESPWKDGKGDVLKELSEACKEYGLLYGVYLSPWDQNHPAYGTPDYNQIFANTLAEIHDNYGDIFEQWFDGANGEGHGGKKQVYDWPLFHKTVYDRHPNAIVFSDVGPDCRWMGNEKGVAGETNWSTLNVEGFGPGYDAPPVDTLNRGNIRGEKWVPAEVDVSIRPGWFYSPETNDKVKTLKQLVDIYYTSVGRNANLLLNVPPDRRGRIHPDDSARLIEFRKALDEIFKDDLAKGATVMASHTRGNASQFAVSNILNDDYDSYWAVDNDVLDPYIELTFDEPKSFNRLLLQEYIPLGQRVAGFNVQSWNDATDSWDDLAKGTTIGYKRILHFPEVTASKLRIHITSALACPVLNKIEVYNDRINYSSLNINRDKDGWVHITSEQDASVYYSVDGGEVHKYVKPFMLSKGGIVKVFIKADNNSDNSEAVTADFDIAPAKWMMITKTENSSYAIDSDVHTSAVIEKSAPLVLDLGEVFVLKGFTYTPSLEDSESASNIFKYTLYASHDGKNWKEQIASGIFNNIKNNPVRQDVYFDKPVNARYLKIEPLELTFDKAVQYSVAEIGIITR